MEGGYSLSKGAAKAVEDLERDSSEHENIWSGWQMHRTRNMMNIAATRNLNQTKLG